MCLPKEQGGLNFRDLEGFNQAHLIFSPDLLVSKVIKARYFASSSFMEAELGKKPSYFWRSYMWSRELLGKGLRMRIGNGESI